MRYICRMLGIIMSLVLWGIPSKCMIIASFLMWGTWLKVVSLCTMSLEIHGWMLVSSNVMLLEVHGWKLISLWAATLKVYDWNLISLQVISLEALDRYFASLWVKLLGVHSWHYFHYYGRPVFHDFIPGCVCRVKELIGLVICDSMNEWRCQNFHFIADFIIAVLQRCRDSRRTVLQLACMLLGSANWLIRWTMSSVSQTLCVRKYLFSWGNSRIICAMLQAKQNVVHGYAKVVLITSTTHILKLRAIYFDQGWRGQPASIMKMTPTIIKT